MFRKLILFIGSFFANLFHAGDIADLQNEEAKENKESVNYVEGEDGIDGYTRYLALSEDETKYQDDCSTVRGGWIGIRGDCYVFQRDEDPYDSEDDDSARDDYRQRADDVIQVHMNDKTYPALEVVDYEGNYIEQDDDQAMLKLQFLMKEVKHKITSKVSDLAGITLREFRDAEPFGWKGIKYINNLHVRSCVLSDRKHCIILCDEQGFATRFDEARRGSKWKRLEDHEKLYRVKVQNYEDNISI